MVFSMCSEKKNSDKSNRIFLDDREIPNYYTIIFEYMLEKKENHWDIFKNLEQKAFQLILFSGLIAGLIINFTDSFPLNYDEFINYGFLSFIVSIFFGFIVILNTFVFDKYTPTGFINEESEESFQKCLSSSDDYLNYNNFLLLILGELTDEIQFLRKKNTNNSILLSVGFTFFGFAIVCILIIIA